MKFKQYIKEEEEINKAQILKAINFAMTKQDMMEIVGLISSASQHLENEDLIRVQQLFDRKWTSMMSNGGV